MRRPLKPKQYLSIRSTDRLAEAGSEPSVGSAGEPYDNALAETIIGLFETAMMRRNGRWRSIEEIEFATSEWADWLTHQGVTATFASNLSPLHGI